MKKIIASIFVAFFLAGCSRAARDESPSIISMQLVDRNGFSETISTKDRIAKYKNSNFLDPQPYQKVLRVFSKNTEGKHASTITTYHPSGYIWQYLDVVDGRANGSYREWHANGQMKMDLGVIEGFADLQQSAQRTWVFDGLCRIWDEDGHLVAEISYERGMLHNPSIYYFSSGKIKKKVPYFRDQIDGNILEYDEEGFVLETIPYQNGMRQGRALCYFDKDHLHYDESYDKDLILEGRYYDREGKLISEIVQGNGFRALFQEGSLFSLVEFQKGEEKGKVELFSKQGMKIGLYHQENGQKQGEEWVFHLDEKSHTTQPKLCMNWHEDLLQGEVKTWYANGALESQREYNQNKKHGLSFAWYKNGDVMLMEEYDQNNLIQGSYYKKGDKKIVSRVENGKGIATLYSPDGAFIKKVTYEKGQPVLDGF